MTIKKTTENDQKSEDYKGSLLSILFMKKKSSSLGI